MGNGKTGGFGWWWHSSEDTIDKIDPAKLARDCKIYLLAVYRACSDEFLPIEQEKAAADIYEILKRYAEETEGKLDMTLSLMRAEKLVKATEKIADRKVKIGSERYNEYIMEMSRILVPLNYVEGDNFEHDLAIRGNDMPVLTVLDNYKNVEYGSDEWKMVTVAACVD